MNTIFQKLTGLSLLFVLAIGCDHVDDGGDSETDTATGNLPGDEGTDPSDGGTEAEETDGADFVAKNQCAPEDVIRESDISCEGLNVSDTDCMAHCGAAVEWMSGYKCPSPLRCVEANCSDTDGVSGYCFPPDAIKCNEDIDCACLPHPCPGNGSGTLSWTCNQGTCEPDWVWDW